LVPGQSRPNDAGPSASDQTNRAERRSFRETVFHCHPGESRDAPPALPTRSQRKSDDARLRRTRRHRTMMTPGPRVA
jgi:hypothetical protein